MSGGSVMSFEIVDRDLLARIGRLETKSGVVETPLLLPVINPGVRTVPPRKLEEEFGCRALITNAYITLKNFKDEALEKGLHSFLDFRGSIMTDSGAYQLLVYRGVETTPEEIVRFQEKIDTDIATILDIPTGWGVTKKYAEYTVNETVKRAKALKKMRNRDDILWVAPVQGGQYLDLVAKSAKQMGKLPFQIYALGSPTPVMEQYKFDILVDMIIAAKKNLPPDRPLHLFGAGHPFMFSLAVALGCDIFDSAAYALFAREDRYLTDSGTTRLEQLQYLPCSCPVCNRNDPETLRALPKEERVKMLAEHNLHVSFCELRRIKEAITEGRLWEHMDMRAHSHPSLLQALKKLRKHSEFLETQSPIAKKSGRFYFGSLSLARPEVVRHSKRLASRYSKPPKSRILLLLPQTVVKPFHTSKEHRAVTKQLEQQLGGLKELVHVCTYTAPFGVVPAELDEIYPLSQNEIAFPPDPETIKHVAKETANYILSADYSQVFLLRDQPVWRGKVVASCKRACEKKHIPFQSLGGRDPWSNSTLEQLTSLLRAAVDSIKYI